MHICRMEGCCTGATNSEKVAVQEQLTAQYAIYFPADFLNRHWNEGEVTNAVNLQPMSQFDNFWKVGIQILCTRLTL